MKRNCNCRDDGAGEGESLAKLEGELLTDGALLSDGTLLGLSASD
jgi:hypothetical protein